ncbi:MAG: NAD(P)H-hydrate epimerase, partial [Actinomycetota bacterium]
MLDVLTAADVRRQDAACEARGIPVARLMENAGFAVAHAVRQMLGVTYGRRVVIVCGTGNNAGDGLVAGRWLHDWGAHATAVLALPGDLKGPAAEALLHFPGRLVGPPALHREIERAGVVIDALFGIGLSRAPEDHALRAIQAMNAAAAPVVSVDIPSGMAADQGVAPGEWVRAEGIVTLGGLKPALLFRSDCAAWIEVADIGVPAEVRAGCAVALEAADVAGIVPVRTAAATKRRAGVVLVVAGSRAMPGAAVLA